MSNNVIVTGNIRQPKWGHLKELRKALKLCEPILIHEDVNVTSLGKHLEICSSIENFFVRSTIYMGINIMIIGHNTIDYNLREALG